MKIISDGESPYYVIGDINNPEDILYTNLNFSGESNITGNITGENDIYNTLITNVAGTVNIDGEKVIVNTINNTGTINLSGEVSTLKNIVNLNGNSLLSTKNNVVQNISIGQINSDNSNISFDLGDTFTIDTASELSKDIANVSSVNVDENTAKSIDNLSTVNMFTNETLNLTGSANFYYKGYKYEIKQSDLNKKILTVFKDTSISAYELGDSAEDVLSGNYIVTESSLTKDAGMVKGNDFKISGNDINVNSHNGLVIDGTQNPNGTILETGIFGAANDNLLIKNNGFLSINAKDKQIKIGNLGEMAIHLNEGEALFNANHGIDVNGSIKGTDYTKDFIKLIGNSVSFNDISNVTVLTQVQNVNLNSVATNTYWIVNNGMINVKQDNYLSSDGTNSLTFNGCGVNLINNAANDIRLSSLILNDNMETKIDIDLKKQVADRFVFNNSSDVITNGNKIELSCVNLLNKNAVLTNEKYTIPFVSSAYNSQNLIGNVKSNFNRQILTPIYKYALKYEDNGTEGNIVLSRFNQGNYNDYNPSIYIGSVVAQVGGFLNQINSYDVAFSDMDKITLMPQSVRTAIKLRNKYASNDTNLFTYDPNQFPQEHRDIWLKPYTTFEKVNMKNGPKVENTAYGTYFGGDSGIVDLSRGWYGVLSAYAGYTGSHQNYQANSIYQNGGQLGLTGVFYKDRFFMGLTANVGASVANASTVYGKEDIVLLTSGVASKTGYNFGFKNDKFIIQPSYLMSYSFVNTFDYTNAIDVKVKSDPLNTIQIVPGVKFIANLKNRWQPYLSVQMVWNIMDKTRFKVNDVMLEQLSVKPYVQYGIGIQKEVGERLTGYAQTMLRNGGRNGVSLSLGFRWKI